MKKQINKLLSIHAINIKNPVYSFIYKACRRFIYFYKNANYDYRHNGEEYLLKKLGECKIGCVFDVGANHGEWLKIALGYLPSCDVHAFEISPNTFTILNENIDSNTRVKLNNFGLCDEEKDVKIRFDQARDTHTSMVETSVSGREKFDSLDVKCIPGDMYVKNNKIDHIDFLKLDVEGAENLILYGFKKSFSNKIVSVVQFEYTEINIDSRFLLKDYYHFFEKNGFRVGKLYPNGVDFKNYEYKDEDFVGPNYIAVHESCIEIIKLLKI